MMSGDKREGINVILDTASNVTLVTQRVAEILELKGSRCELNLGGIGEKNTKCQSALVDFELSEPQNPNVIHTVRGAQVVPVISDQVWAFDWSKILGNKGLPFVPPYKDGRIDLLIGLDHIDLIMIREYKMIRDKKGKWERGYPVALKTVLGWTCTAKIQERPEDSVFMTSYKQSLRDIPKSCESVQEESGQIQFTNQSAAQLQTNQSSKPLEIEDELNWSSKECKAQAKAYTLLAIKELEEDSAVFDCDQIGYSFLTQEEKAYALCYENAVKLMEDIMCHQDNFPAESTVTASDEYVINLLKDTFQIRDGRAYISPIWKPGQPEPGLNNFAYALARHKSVVSKLSDENFDVIDKIFEDYLAKGITREVTDDVIDPFHEDAIHWPMFAVAQPLSETTPVRPVMDGKVKCLENGKMSINEKCFLPGPNLLQNLTQVLNAFRQYDVAFTGDISKMFLKVLVPEEHRKYGRFLWTYKNQRTKVRHFEFLGQLFGNVGSPTASIMATQLNAMNYIDRFPRSVRTIMERTIMDDHLDSFPEWPEAEKVLKGLITIHGGMGLSVAKISTNSPELHRALPKEATESKNMVDFEKYYSADIEYAPGTVPKIPTMRTLGQYWDMVNDIMSYRKYDADENIKWTKVLCLSQAHKIFDPLGFVIPVMLEAKLILRTIFINHPSWKAEEIFDEEMKRWDKWLINLPLLKDLKFPRVTMPGLVKTHKKVTYHCFADSSKDAFCAVIYVRLEYTDGRIYTNFLQSRSKLTQKKPVRTIPKNELLGIELATELALHAVVPYKGLPQDITIWSDSKTALQWTRMNPDHLNIFCHNYVKKSLNRIPMEQIRWVPGAMNPADLGTRVHTAEELKSKISLWQQGPAFLHQSPDRWPSLPELEKTEDVLQEVKKEFKLFTFLLYKPEEHLHQENLNLLEAKWYSSFAKMLRVISYVVRFLHKTRERVLKRRRGEPVPKLLKYKKSLEKNLIPNPAYILEAEARVIFVDQQIYMQDDISRLDRKGKLPMSKKLSALGPELVEYDGLDLGPTGVYHLRLTGRVKSAKHLNDRMKRPYVISHLSALSDMMIKHYHERVLKHVGGPKCLQCEIHRAYWLTGSINSIKRKIRECVTCRRRRPKPTGQKMAPLPDCRIPGALKEQVAPFQMVALDAAGPYNVLIGEGRGQLRRKRWFLVIRDLLYGGVYIDVLRRMDLSHFLSALDRFSNERTTPSFIVCDNGTNFAAGKKELSRMWDEIDQNELVKARHNIEWSFTPPEAPYMNGVAERMVGATKAALATIMPDDSRLTDDTFLTTLKFAQRTLNDRPIAYMESDHRNRESLTPNHFLMSGNLASDLAPVDESLTLDERYQYLLFLKNQFWERFIKEVTPSMREYEKWQGSRTEIQVGDVVVLLDEKSYKQHKRWPLGEIIKICPNPCNVKNVRKCTD